MPRRKKPRTPSAPGSAASLSLESLEYLLAVCNYKAGCEAKMRAFDRLPKSVRAALTASQFNWNVEQLHQAWCEKRMTARQLVKHIRSEDRIRLRERKRPIMGD